MSGVGVHRGAHCGRGRFPIEPLPFTFGGYAPILFWTTFLLWTTLEVFVISRLRASETAVREERDSKWMLLALMAMSVTLGFAFALLLPVAAVTASYRMVVFWSGTFLMFMGLALRWYAIQTLGRFFTVDVAVSTGQRVIESGPYRLVRHPAYSGTMLTLLGFGLALTNWASLAAILLCGLTGLLYRARAAEELLVREFGRPYVEYMRRTRRFIPYVF